MHRIIWLTWPMFTACRNFWISPGQAPWRQNCGTIDALNYVQYQEIWGNGIDDTCDGLIDPGNGSSYLEIHNNNERDVFLEFYNNNSPDEATFDTFLSPNQPWEASFLLITQFDTSADEWTYLYGNDSSTLGLRVTDDGFEVLHEVRGDTVYRLTTRVDTPISTNTALTIQFVPGSNAICALDTADLVVLVNNELYNQSINREGELTLDCAFEDTSTVTFGGRDVLPLGFSAFNGAIDDLIVVERTMSPSERSPLILQLLEAYFNPNTYSTESVRTGLEDIMWQNIDLFNGTCDVGFMDYESNINTRYISDQCDVLDKTIYVEHIDDDR